MVVSVSSDDGDGDRRRGSGMSIFECERVSEGGRLCRMTTFLSLLLSFGRPPPRLFLIYINVYLAFESGAQWMDAKNGKITNGCSAGNAGCWFCIALSPLLRSLPFPLRSLSPLFYHSHKSPKFVDSRRRGVGRTENEWRCICLMGSIVKLDLCIAQIWLPFFHNDLA